MNYLRIVMYLVSALLLTTARSAVCADNVYRIADDHGGVLSVYIEKYVALRESGRNVMIDGVCSSSCTLVFGIIPQSRICVTSQANVGFHSASKLGADWTLFGPAHMVEDPGATAVIWHLYPRGVQQWLNQHGGMPPPEAMVFLNGPELALLYRPC